MAIYRCELHNGRRVVREEQRQIYDIKNGAEMHVVLGSMAKAIGAKPAGHRLRVYERVRNGWRKVAEVTA